MKWFKHFSMAHADDKIVSIRSKFGMWGIGTYWTLVERVAEQMNGEDPKPEASILIPELCSFLGCKRNKLVSFLDHLRNIRGMDYDVTENVLKIRVTKLRTLADNYIKYDGMSSKRLQRQKEMSSKQEVEVEVEVDTEQKKKERDGDLPPVFLDEKTQEAWLGWQAYRKEIHKPMTTRTVRKQYEFLKSHENAIAIIEQSIRNGWQGLFEEKTDGTDKQGNRRIVGAGGSTTANDLRRTFIKRFGHEPPKQ